jgi:hypothetical protein
MLERVHFLGILLKAANENVIYYDQVTLFLLWQQIILNMSVPLFLPSADWPFPCTLLDPFSLLQIADFGAR